MANPKPIVIGDLRGGRNDTDPPMSLPFNQCTEALNVDWKDATVAHKRAGATSISLTGGSAFTTVAFLFRHVPGADQSAAELWGIDFAVLVKRLTGGTSWANVTMDDAINDGTPDRLVGASLNGKLFLAYSSAVNRLHVYDPGLAAPRVRRVGLATPSAPTITDTGSGAYPATIRYVRVRWIQVTGSTLTRRSEPSASQSFTPSGSGSAYRITRPTAAGEGETHWEVEASPDNSTWYTWYSFGTGAGAHIAIATTFVDDGNVPASYPLLGGTPDESGQNVPPISSRYLLTDGNRLLLAGAGTTGEKTSRVWFTPVLGSTDHGDDERIPNTTTQKNWVDLNERDGGAITGIGGPLNGVPYAFKYRQVWKLRPTGDVAVPYLPRKLRDDVGCIANHSIAIGEDQTGRSALYFMSHRGPYRVTFDGDVEYLGRDNEATWRSMNLAATLTLAHSVYYPDLHQWWVWIATGAANAPDVKMMFDVHHGFPDEHGQIRGGWAKHTGLSAVAHSACLFSNTIAASMSLDLKPYAAYGGVAVFKCDSSALDDDGTDFQAYATTRPLLTTEDLGRKVGLGESTLIGKALAGSDVSVTIVRDFGKETRTHSVSLAPAASETRVVKKVEGSEMGEADAIQITIGDSAANEEVWTVDALIAPLVTQERR